MGNWDWQVFLQDPGGEYPTYLQWMLSAWGWTVSVAFLARVEPDAIEAKAADDAEEVGWFALDELPELAFDHAMILARARARLVDRSA